MEAFARKARECVAALNLPTMASQNHITIWCATVEESKAADKKTVIWLAPHQWRVLLKAKIASTGLI